MEINTLFSVLYCISILVLPFTCDTKHSATIRDFTKDKNMIDTCNDENHTYYCANMVGNCHKGTHIMCMTYITGLLMGVQCDGGAMFQMRQGIKDTIINEIATLRKDAFEGFAPGKGHDHLPRAWSLDKKFKLSWDSDLALFAQVWTNQCQRTLDFCRDTKKFSNVDQFVGIDYFTRKEWQNIIPKDDRIKAMKEKCLTTAKVKAAVKYMIDLIKIDYKEQVTEDLIKKFDGKRNTYLTLLNDKSTHIGCGMSYYLDYKWFKDTDQRRDVFTLQLVCNVAHKPLKGAAVYNMVRPSSYVDPTTTTTLKPAVLKGKGLRGMAAGPGVVVMPIIKVEDAPQSLTDQRPGVSTFRPSLRSIASRKSSIFSRAPLFNLPSANYDNASNGNILDRSSLKHKLQTLLEQPRRDIPQLEELLKQIVKKYQSEENQISRIGRVEIPDTVISEVQEHVSSKSNHVPANIVNDDVKNKLQTLLEQPRRDIPQLRELLKQTVKNYESEDNKISRIGSVAIPDTVISGAQEHVSRKSNHVPANIVNNDADDELSQLTNDKLKKNYHGLTGFIGDEEYYPHNTGILNNKDSNKELDAQTQFHIPIIRKLKPIAHVREISKLKNSHHDNTLNEVTMIDYNDDKTNMSSKIEPFNYAEGNNINSYKSIASEDLKLERRVYLENEVSKLKRKLHNLRQYIHKNDVNENARIRPMATSHIGQQTSKFDERRHFYMPDRAHPLHEY